MKKLKLIIFGFVFISAFLLFKKEALAEDCGLSTDPPILYKNTRQVVFQIYSNTNKPFDTNKKYGVQFNCTFANINSLKISNLPVQNEGSGNFIRLSLDKPNGGCEVDPGNHGLTIYEAGALWISTATNCNANYTIQSTDAPTGTNPNTNNLSKGSNSQTTLHSSVPQQAAFSIICSSGGIETALGCISTEGPTSLVIFLLRLALGIGGGIAFLLMLFGVFQIITSAGSPERLKAGQELITSALIGLMMIIFSIFLLQLIGVQILGLNAFGFGS